MIFIKSFIIFNIVCKIRLSTFKKTLWDHFFLPLCCTHSYIILDTIANFFSMHDTLMMTLIGDLEEVTKHWTSLR